MNTLGVEHAASIPLVSIVIPAYNGGECISICLDSCLKQDYVNIEIIVVDSASVDNTLEIVYGYRGLLDLKIIECTNNVGYAGGANIGISKANGQYVLILNQDVELDVEYIRSAVAVFCIKECIGAVGGKVYGMDKDGIHQEVLQETCCLYSPEVSCRSYSLQSVRHLEQVFGANACATFVSRAALEDIRLENGDYYDSRFWSYSEDVDLWIRLRIKGWGIVFSMECVCWHMGASTSKFRMGLHHKSWRIQRIIVRNRVLLLIGTVPLAESIFDIPFFLLWYMFAMIRCVSLRLSSVKNVVGFIDGFRMIRQMMQKRQEIYGRRRCGVVPMLEGLTFGTVAKLIGSQRYELS